MPIKPRVIGGPNAPFLERYGFDGASHPMDWFAAFMPLTTGTNREDLGVSNVKGNKTRKFAISNWTAYSNTEALMCNAGEPGHIFAGKFKQFKNKDILKIIIVYIIDGLAPSPQLVQKMQRKTSSLPMAMTGFHLSLGLDGNRSTGCSGTSLRARIC